MVVEKQGNPVAPSIRYRTDWPDIPPSELKPGWALVRTLASAFNHMDLWVGMGIPGVNLTYPRVSGCDACGEVEAVGPGVDPAWVGRRVIVNAAVPVPDRVHPEDPPASTLAPNYELIGEHHNGMHTEKFMIPAVNMAAIPSDRDPVEAAAFGLCALTAYSMVKTKANLLPGQSVLVTGIGGGVATSALAIARYFGCPVVVTSRHQWKLDRAKELGAACTVLDKGQDWSKEVRAWTRKRGVDLAVDSSGKATHLNCVKSLARGGCYATPGCTSGPDATTDLARIFWNQLRLVGSTMGTPEEFQEVASLYREGHLKPVVDKVFTPDQCTAAYERIEAAEQFGKIVVKW
jgi:NADPH:quinone reductase-like Zn-dependent oxidoreductase